MPRTTTTAATSAYRPAETLWGNTPLPDDPRSSKALTASMERFQAFGREGEAMIAKLSSLLSRMEALPVEDVDGWVTGTARYLGLRYGPLRRPLPPGLWRWSYPLAHAIVLAWDLASESHFRFKQCSRNQRRDAVDRWGVFLDERGAPSPLLRLGWPVEALERLDRLAANLCIDVRARQRLGGNRGW